jgi:hypothetical protein
MFKEIIVGFLVWWMVVGPVAVAEAATYWARPNGTHNITGLDAFCNTIKSIDSAGTSVSRTFVPAQMGTIGAAVACARAAGDTVLLSGINGVYPNSDTHRVNTAVPSITPAYGLKSGTGTGTRPYTTILGVPEDPRPVLNIHRWFNTSIPNWGFGSPVLTSTRTYIKVEYVRVNGNTGWPSGYKGGGDGGSAEFALEGAFFWLHDVHVYNSAGFNVSSFINDSVNPCSVNHHHMFTNNVLSGAGNATGVGYNFYLNSCNQTWINNELAFARGGMGQVYHSDSSPTVAFHSNADDSIFERNWGHDVLIGEDPTQTPGQCAGVTFDGLRSRIVNNLMDFRSCSTTAVTSGSIFSLLNPSGTGALIANNTMYNPRSYGIQLYRTSGLVLVQNNLYNSAFGFSLIDPGAGGGAAGATQQTNITTGIINCIISLGTSATVGANFHLKTGTNPCVDTGTANTSITIDKDNTLRVQPTDIGAYERSGTVPDTLAPLTPSGFGVE